MSTSIHQPTPSSSTEPSSWSQRSSTNRLLASHHSVLDLLHQKQSFDSSVNSTPRLSPNPNLEMRYGIPSVSSWQSIGDYLAPRPTSSVLSNSDTEEETNLKGDQSVNTVKLSVPVIPEFIDDDDDDDDLKTIEIGMNDGRTSHLSSLNPGSISVSTGNSSFIMPQISADDLLNADSEISKILIIGHRKSSFFKMLEEPLSYRFTLNVDESYNIIMVIFDGLLKIGNILNFIKQNHEDLRDKMFIPIFKNINQQVIYNIMNSHRLNLLCPPIDYENQTQVDNLLDLLNQEFILRDSFYSDKEISAFNDEVQDHEYQLISLQGTSNSQVLSESIHPRSNVSIYHRRLEKPNGHSTSSMNQLIFENSHTRKQRRKNQRKSTMIFLSATLSLGIGIGITAAFVISNTIGRAQPTRVDPPLLKSTLSPTGTMLRKAVDLIKDNVVSFKQSTSGVSQVAWVELKNVLESFASKWNDWVVNVGKDANNSMMWLF